MNFFAAFFIWLLFLPIAFAGNDNFPVGSRQAAMGNAGVTLADLWSVHHNQAALAGLQSPVAGLNYHAKFSEDFLSRKSAAAAIPSKKAGVFALAIDYYGFELYNEQKIGLAYAKSFGRTISIGAQLDYLSVNIGEDYGSRYNIAVEAGVMAKLTDKIELGAHIYNPARAKLSDYDDERSPVIMRLGAAYRFSGKVILCAEAEKNIDAKNLLKAGLEYNVGSSVFLRAGIMSNPSLFSFGFGIYFKKFRFDLATSMDAILGHSPQASLIYVFR